MNVSIVALVCFLFFGPASALISPHFLHKRVQTTRDPLPMLAGGRSHSSIQLNMVGRLFRRNTKKKSVQTLEREQTKKEEKKQKAPEQLWRVMLYNTEWQPDITARLLVRVIPALNRAAAYELVCRARGMGKVALVIARKKQAEGYCLGLQRLGLPATIEPHDVER